MNVLRLQAGGLRTVLNRPREECDGAWHRLKHVGLYSVIGLGKILTKSIILLEIYELFKYFNIKVLTQKLKVCFVDHKVIGMGNDNLWHFSYFCFNT